MYVSVVCVLCFAKNKVQSVSQISQLGLWEECSLQNLESKAEAACIASAESVKGRVYACCRGQHLEEALKDIGQGKVGPQLLVSDVVLVLTQPLSPEADIPLP